MSDQGKTEQSSEQCHRAGGEATHKTGRHAPRTPRVTVTHPQMTVVESAEPADRAALDTAITLFVKWAIRARAKADPPSAEVSEVPTANQSADYAPSN